MHDFLGLSRTIKGALRLLILSTSGLLALTVAIQAAPNDPEEGGQWGPVISWPHIAVSAANLPDGRILTWSGSERDTWPGTEFTYSATWNPETGEFIEINHPTHNMFCAHLAMMEDGRVFVNGGRNQQNSPWTSIFDYNNDQWVQVENMESGGRWYPTTLMLGDGDIFTAIGTASLQRYPERWDPDTGWQILNGIDFNAMVLDDYFTTGSHGESRWWPLLHLAPNGQIFHSGPTPKMHYIDPDGTGNFQQSGPEMGAWYHKHGTTIMYDEGKLLTAGGWVSGSNIASTNQAFTVDLTGAVPQVNITNSMNYARKFHNGVMLPNGEVLVVGGNTSGQKFSDNGAILATEIWNPSTEQWREGASMDIPRNYHSVALLMTDGRVLAAGSGYCANNAFCNGSSHMDGQVYSPSYLFNADGTPATRPSIDSAPGRVSSGEVFSVTASPGIQAFSLIKMSSTTHGVNTDVRYLSLPFTEVSSGQYQLTAHSNVNVLSPGYWMLFALDGNGVPSIAKVLQVNSSGMPWIVSLPNQSSLVDEVVSVQVIAGDADGDAITFLATGLPAGVSIDSQSGLISGAATSEGIYDVTVTVSDGDEGSRNKSFAWVIFGSGQGSIVREWWTGITGNAISALTSSSDFPDNPTGSEQISLFETPTNWAENYGTRVSGSLYPPVTGNYIFWIASDDNGQLWLSTDADPANKNLIASVPSWSASRQWDKFPEQQSVAITLEAGKKYYIEALQKEGGGGDNLAVAWQRPGETGPEVIPGAFLSPYVPEPVAPLVVANGHLDNVGSDWQTVTLAETFVDMVVVATPQYQSGMPPAVTRIRNASGNQFEIKVQNPSGTSLSGYTVHYVAVEAGVYNQAEHGITMEAIKFTSTRTDENNSWVGESRSYANTYTQPVVLGQVMTANDDDWSVFWAHSGTVTNPPSATSLFVGKNVAEDIDTTRADETLGYIVVEAGSGVFGTVTFEAGLGGDTIRGVDNAPPFNYSLTAPRDIAVAAVAAMDGNNGGWPVLWGPEGIEGNTLRLAFDEDQINDSERAHTTEQVAYLAMEQTDQLLPLAINPMVIAPQVFGQSSNFTVSATGQGVLEYRWNFGDGTPQTEYSTSSTISHDYSAPGRYVVIVTVRDQSGEEISETFIQTIHAPLTVEKPTVSSPIIYLSDSDEVWNVNPDNDSVTVSSVASQSVVNEISVGLEPRSLGLDSSASVWVVNKGDATISIIDTLSFTLIDTINLPSASQPHGLAFSPDGNEAYIVLEATGQLLKFNAVSRTQIAAMDIGQHPRHVSITADGALAYVSRFITPPLPGEATDAPSVETAGEYHGGEVMVVDIVNMTVTDTVVLRHSDRVVSEHSGPGIPNYLGPAVISPDSLAAWVPSKQDNILAGALRGGMGMTFDQTVRAVSSRIDLVSHTEDFSARVDHDNASVANHAVFGPYGTYLFTALEGNREVAISDAYSMVELLRFDVGRAPQGLALSADGTKLFVHNFMDRSVGIYDISAVIERNEMTVIEETTLATVASEKLTASVLQGKQFFYDARDPRLAAQSYMSCASCHNDGSQDGRVWDFTHVGEGLRNTITLEGHAGMGHGPLHWTANFDEVQDFEAQIRNFAGGLGLMSDADFNTGTRSEPLGDPKAGLSPDLDAMADYVSSLDNIPTSPYRNADGSLTAEAEIGKVVFENSGCASCHSGPSFTDSATNALHDIGTLTPFSGSRLNETLTGLDTPTLLGLWSTAPYLHDGSAATIEEAIAGHIDISLTSTEIAQLAEYLRQADGQEPISLSLTMEAEDAQLFGNMEIGHDSNASGGSYIIAPNGTGFLSSLTGSYAEFTFVVEEEGTYAIEGGVYAPNGNDDSFWVTVNNNTAAPYLWDTLHNTSYATDYVNNRNVTSKVLVDLSPGTHTVQVYQREDGTRLDWLGLEKQDMGSAILDLEAESATLSGNMQVGNDGNARGNQYVSAPNGTGAFWSFSGSNSSYMEFTFTVSEAGNYAIEGGVHAANGSDNSFWVTVDGNNASPYLWDTLVTTSYAADFVNNRNVTSQVVVNLSLGLHTVRVYQREDGTRLDWLRLVLQ